MNRKSLIFLTAATLASCNLTPNPQHTAASAQAREAIVLVSTDQSYRAAADDLVRDYMESQLRGGDHSEFGGPMLTGFKNLQEYSLIGPYNQRKYVCRVKGQNGYGASIWQYAYVTLDRSGDPSRYKGLRMRGVYTTPIPPSQLLN